MRRAILIATLLAATAAPLMASADDTRHDQRQVQQDQRALQQDKNAARRDGVVTPGERRNIQGDKRDLRTDQRDARTDRWDRNNRSWWRGRPGFTSFAGRRAGFWFAPGYGYYRVDPRWAGYRWTRGAFVPRMFWRYTVADPWFYGLRPAYRGFAWIWLGNNLALVNMRTGRIVEIVPNVYDY